MRIMDAFDQENGDEYRGDPLQLAHSSDSMNCSHSDIHLKTYTAGEDRSRLAAAAKELGLQQARQPRKQVRREISHRGRNVGRFKFLQDLFLDSSMEDIRMRAVYSAHVKYSDEDEALLLHLRRLSEGRLQRLIEDGQEEEEEEISEDGHAVGIGGDIPSAVVGIIKGMVGPAILYLPHGFASAGYAFAFPILATCTVLFLYSAACLLDAWRLEQSKTENGDSETTRLLIDPSAKRKRVLLSYPELAYRALGNRGESAVKAGIALMQSGVCLTYLIFVPQNLRTSMLSLLNVDVAPRYWLIVMIALQIPLSWIRDIRRLTPTNLLANCMIVYGLSVCLGYAVEIAASHQAAYDRMEGDDVKCDGPLGCVWSHLRLLSSTNKDWFLFIGTCVLLFEGSITLLVPLQEAVQTDNDRALFPVIYKRVIMGIIMFYTVFAITCWMAFGDRVNVVLTTSLPSGALATSVQLAYSIAVVFTFPLQNFPALEIVTRTVQSSAGTKNFFTRRNVLSSVLVLMLATVAVCTMDALAKVVSLMGSLLGCPIAFVFPPLIHSHLDPNLTTKRLWLNRLCALLGMVAMVVASTTTMLTWK